MLNDNVGKALTGKQAAFIKSALLTQNDVLIVDEAGMISAKQLANVIEMTKQAGAKLVLVGDTAQLQSIEAGAAFRNILERNKSIKLTKVRRQHKDWQCTATLHMSKGNVAKALHSYHKNGCVIQAKTRNAAKEKLVKDVMKEHINTPEQNRLVLAYTRKDVADLNAMIRAEMVKSSKVGNKDTDIAVTVKKADHEWQERHSFAKGDRILFRKNDRDLGVMNGTFGTVKVAEQNRFNVKLDNGKGVIFSPQDYNHFQHGYACTVHKSQGMTVDKSYILATPHFDSHTSYVALSRHKHRVRIYASKKDFKTLDKMQRELGKDGENLSTLDFTDARKHHIEPEQETPPSFFNRMKSFFIQGQEKSKPESSAPEHQYSGNWIEENESTRAPEEKHITARSLDQQDFVKLSEEFIRKAKVVEAQSTIELEPQMDNSPKLER